MPKKNQIQDKLLAAIKSNNEAVLKDLYQRNYQKVESYVLKNNGNHSQAKDIFQEAFVAMWKQIKEDTFTPENSTAIDGFLYSIARNKWIDILRSSRHKKELPMEKNTNQYTAKSDHLIEEKEKDEEKYEKISTAYKKLNSRCRKILEQFYFEKKSMTEIAAFFDMKSTSARNAKYRCMEKLRKLVHEREKSAG